MYGAFGNEPCAGSKVGDGLLLGPAMIIALIKLQSAAFGRNITAMPTLGMPHRPYAAHSRTGIANGLDAVINCCHQRGDASVQAALGFSPPYPAYHLTLLWYLTGGCLHPAPDGFLP